MSITIGDTKISRLGVGDKDIARVYLGDNLIYEKKWNIPLLTTTSKAVDFTMNYENGSLENTYVFAVSEEGTFIAKTNVNPSDPKIVLDLSNNTGVATIKFRDAANCSKISVLNISNYPDSNTRLLLYNLVKLQKLYCPNIGLSNLDVGQNKEIGALDIEKNPIKTLYTGALTELRIFKVNATKTLESLNLENNLKLEKLDCSLGQLTQLDVSTNTKLTQLDCSNNSLGAAVIDQIIIALNGHNLQRGTLIYTGNATPTEASFDAHNNLISKGWSIKGDKPLAIL